MFYAEQYLEIRRYVYIISLSKNLLSLTVACCHQLVNNLLRADDYRLVGTTCFESVSLVNFVTKLLPDFSKTVQTKMRTHLFGKKNRERDREHST